MSETFSFDTLFQYSQTVTPFLEGRLKSIELTCENSDSPLEAINSQTNDQPTSIYSSPSITYGLPCSADIKVLYDSIATVSPEAKQAYWLTRTWGLLCWQPIYLSFISIYACHGLPKIKDMSQDLREQFIAGYQFNDDGVRINEQNTLIEIAATELHLLFDFYREEIGEWARIRPGFTNHLFADAILGCIVQFQQFQPEIPNSYFLEQAKIWIIAAGLPLKSLEGLSVNPETSKLHLVRTSCCLVYKCTGRKLCSDCPKLPENREMKVTLKAS
ncbi:siderophore ferric iron reductase [Vibrio gallaecicus]|uniref:siderophore ferric iron reductase n=1 Tax=Vibrio gallaecicus TaxID=552386 RepID=UPI0010C9B6F1|nr:siderophore ferric iron reductase [Vibrio gallaecicus]MDN3616952.1 siderophore ferric iron reductase [Vibrio gallaecicus]